jgi:hypothetical protein
VVYFIAVCIDCTRKSQLIHVRFAEYILAVFGYGFVFYRIAFVVSIFHYLYFLVNRNFSMFLSALDFFSVGLFCSYFIASSNALTDDLLFCSAVFSTVNNCCFFASVIVIVLMHIKSGRSVT